MKIKSINQTGNTISGIVRASKGFDFTQSLKFLDDSGANDRLDVFDTEGGLLQRAMLLNDSPYLVTLSAQDGRDLEVTVQAPDGESAPDETILQSAVDWTNRRFWLDMDMEAVKSALAGDDYGDMLVDSFAPMRPANYASAWEALLISVTHAQVYSGLARKLDDTLAEVFGTKAIFDDEVYDITPRPFDLLPAIEEELKGMRFSRQKASYLTRIPQTIMDESSTYDFLAMREQDGQAVVATLKKLHGVGAWTSQNVTMRGLPHADVFIDEKSTRKAIAPFYYRNLDAITDKNFQETVARFAPYRSFACYYTYMHHFTNPDKDD
ncbi:MAG: hypothetical protein Phog2KO_07820 [Phototrophicaceae bacterium]